MTGFAERLTELLTRLGARAEGEGLEWRQAERGVFAFRAGGYVVTVARDRNPQIAIYDENGEELEAIDRRDLKGREMPDGRSMEEAKNRIWRLARRGAGASAPALDAILSWLDDGAAEPELEPEAEPAPVESAPAEPAFIEPAPAEPGPVEDVAEAFAPVGAEPFAPAQEDSPEDEAGIPASDLAPQAPQAGLEAEPGPEGDLAQAPAAGLPLEEDTEGPVEAPVDAAPPMETPPTETPAEGEPAVDAASGEPPLNDVPQPNGEAPAEEVQAAPVEAEGEPEPETGPEKPVTNGAADPGRKILGFRPPWAR